MCDIIQEHDLTSYSASLKELIVSTQLTHEQKVSLLKIKLDFIINGKCGGKTRFFAMVIIGALLTCTVRSHVSVGLD